MICRKCKKEFSHKVYKHHIKRCRVGDTIAIKKPADFVSEGPVNAINLQDIEQSEEKIRARGKELRIAAAHNKGLDKLVAEIAEIEAKDNSLLD